MQLYTFLCGPVVRRIEPKKVCLWFATSIRPKSAEVFIYHLSRKNPVGTEYSFEESGWVVGYRVNTNTKYNVYQLGGQLFVVLLEVTPEHGTFLEETLFGYDVLFEFDDSDKVILKEKDVTSQKGGAKKLFVVETLNQENKYTYERLPYPVIIIPNQNKPNSKILYGSCRKTHGSGSGALNAADTLLEDYWRGYETYWKNWDHWTAPSAANEPQLPVFSLFHLGDQIYADDLHEEVFKFVRELADSLMNYDETIPAYENVQELSLTDLIEFLNNYLKSVKGYHLDDLNLPAKAAYSSSNKRKNVVLFLKKYYQTYLSNDKDEFDFGRLPDQFLQGALDLGGFIHALDKLTDKNNTLIDLNEILPRSYLLKNLKTSKTKVNSVGFGERRNFVRKNSSITTDDDGHLLSFGEFAALYLINWSDLGFSKKLNDYKLRNILEDIYHGNKKVGRLFANVPSYMIFDDHEITDDWNCDQVWRTRVEKSVTGKRMVANGLAAYWAFQGWGNDPDVFSDGKLIGAITEHLNYMSGNEGQEDTRKSKKYEDSLWEFADWAFIAPTNPLAIFFDNRTLRDVEEEMDYYPQLNGNKKYRASRLMSPKAFDKAAALIKSSAYKLNDPIIFCVPTPIIGSALTHDGQVSTIDGSFNRDFYVVGKLSAFQPPGRYINDWELWWSSPRGKYEFLNFIDTIVKPSRVFILSGDVHYGFHHSANLVSQLTGKVYPVEQLTSSALKNNTVDKFKDINNLAYASISLDTSAEKYKVVDESYPYPKKAALQFRLKGHLVKYTEIIDEDSWLIPQNNTGLIEFIEKNNKFKNQFLYSKEYYARVVISISLNNAI